MYQADQNPLTAEQAATARRGYLAAVSELDQRIGELLGVLDRTRPGDGHDRAVHGRPRRDARRARPLVQDVVLRRLRAGSADRLRDRASVPARIEAPVSHLDLAPTIAALAGVEPAEARVLRRQPRGCAHPWRGASGEAAAEYLAEGVTAPALMLRKGVSSTSAAATIPSSCSTSPRIRWSCTIWRWRTHRRPR